MPIELGNQTNAVGEFGFFLSDFEIGQLRERKLPPKYKVDLNLPFMVLEKSTNDPWLHLEPYCRRMITYHQTKEPGQTTDSLVQKELIFAGMLAQGTDAKEIESVLGIPRSRRLRSTYQLLWNIREWLTDLGEFDRFQQKLETITSTEKVKEFWAPSTGVAQDYLPKPETTQILRGLQALKMAVSASDEIIDLGARNAPLRDIFLKLSEGYPLYEIVERDQDRIKKRASHMMCGVKAFVQGHKMKNIDLSRISDAYVRSFFEKGRSYGERVALPGNNFDWRIAIVLNGVLHLRWAYIRSQLSEYNNDAYIRYLKGLKYAVYISFTLDKKKSQYLQVDNKEWIKHTVLSTGKIPMQLRRFSAASETDFIHYKKEFKRKYGRELLYKDFMAARSSLRRLIVSLSITTDKSGTPLDLSWDEVFSHYHRQTDHYIDLIQQHLRVLHDTEFETPANSDPVTRVEKTDDYYYRLIEEQRKIKPIAKRKELELLHEAGAPHQTIARITGYNKSAQKNILRELRGEISLRQRFSTKRNLPTEKPEIAFANRPQSLEDYIKEYLLEDMKLSNISVNDETIRIVDYLFSNMEMPYKDMELVTELLKINDPVLQTHLDSWLKKLCRTYYSGIDIAYQQFTKDQGELTALRRRH